MAQIECRDVSLGYDGRVAAEGVSMSVRSGDYLYIIGENGSGKSTLIRGLLGLIRPISGEVIYGDGLSRRNIGYIPQQTTAQRDFPASVREVVISGCLGHMGLRPFYGKAERERACLAMTRLKIHDIMNSSYRELSGGQQQRVLLARALCAAGRLLLLDEPAAGLDPVMTAELYHIIGDLNKNDGITIIMVSHDLRAVANEATHVLHMKKSPVFYGTREQYLSSEMWKRYSGAGMEGEI